MTIRPTYPHSVCSLGFACAFAALAAPANAACEGPSRRIAEAQQSTTIADTNGRQHVVKSTTQFLTGPEAHIPETPADTQEPAEKKADSVFATVMATEEKNRAAKSQLEMGELLRSQDKPEAIGHFEKAGANGNGLAYYRLAEIYKDGKLGVEINLPKAIEYYRKAAAENDMAALETLAEMYESGDGVEKNFAKAAEYYRIGADRGVGCPGTQANVQTKLAKMYAEGRGVPKNLAKAIYYSEKSDNAQETIFGDIYRSQAEAESDPEKANALYAKAAKVYTDARRDNKNDSVARYQLGRLYASGKGVTADAAQSAQLIQEAAELGYLPAKFEAEHPSAKSVAIHPDQATVEMIRAAAEAKNAQAQYELGTMLLSGTGVEKNPEEALKWYRLAAKQNSADAQYALGLCSSKGIGVEINPAEAMTPLEKATGAQKDATPKVAAPPPIKIPEEAIAAYIAALTAADTVALDAILTKNPSMAAYIWKHEKIAGEVNGLVFLLDSAPADNKRIEAAKILISKGVDPKIEWNRDMKVDSTRWNLVSYPEELQLGELEMLLKNGADPNFPVCVPGDPPICRLAKAYLQGKENKEEVKAKILLMLKYGADPTHRPLMEGRETALEIAQKANTTDLLDILTSKK